MAKNPITFAIRYLFNLQDCKNNEENTIETVRKEISFVGTNLWLLTFAIFIASIGLNINSTAVIIGAMLISPLMGPIVGAGLALGINDFDLFKKSLMNLGIATGISIIVSGIYFFISPLREAQSELLARTAPNIYDVLIALFGGLSGIIGTSRREKGNVIPGVAIATALMPPLCTAGYGLATGQYRYLFGAFYLYLINCTFICISAFIMVKYLRFRSVSFVDEVNAKRIRAIITVMVAIMVLPAIYFAWEVVRKNSFNQRANQFVSSQFPSRDYTIIMKNLSYNRDSSFIELAFLTKRFTQRELDSIQNLMIHYGLRDTRLIIRQNLQQLTSTDLKTVIEQINLGTIRIRDLEDRLTKISLLSGSDASNLLNELRVVDTSFNKLLAGYLTRTAMDKAGRQHMDSVYTVFLYADSGVVVPETNIEKAKKLIQMRIQKDSIQLIIPGQNLPVPEENNRRSSSTKRKS